MADIFTPVHKRVKPRKEGIGGQLPFLVSFLLIAEIGCLEF